MWAIDLTHTSHTGAQTGIQQVSRNLVRELMESGPVTPLVHDRYSRRWRPLDDLERAHLEPRPEAVPPEKRSSTWSAGQQIRGWWHRLSPRGPVIPGLEGIFRRS